MNNSSVKEVRFHTRNDLLARYPEVYAIGDTLDESRLRQLEFQRFQPTHVPRWGRIVTRTESIRMLELWGERLAVPAGYVMIYEDANWGGGATYKDGVNAAMSPDELIAYRMEAMQPNAPLADILDYQNVVAIEQFSNYWPVDPDIFARTYILDTRRWDETTQQYTELTKVEELMANAGFFPCRKNAPVWAKQTTQPVVIYGLEHQQRGQDVDGRVATEVPIGAMLLLGIDGEPYFQTPDSFALKYDANNPF